MENGKVLKANSKRKKQTMQFVLAVGKIAYGRFSLSSESLQTDRYDDRTYKMTYLTASKSGQQNDWTRKLECRSHRIKKEKIGQVEICQCQSH